MDTYALCTVVVIWGTEIQAPCSLSGQEAHGLSLSKDSPRPISCSGLSCPRVN